MNQIKPSKLKKYQPTPRERRATKGQDQKLEIKIIKIETPITKGVKL